MDAFVLPTGQLELGREIARGSYGAVCKAKLHDVWVCAKVRRVASPVLLGWAAPVLVVRPALAAVRVRLDRAALRLVGCSCVAVGSARLVGGVLARLRRHRARFVRSGVADAALLHAAAMPVPLRHVALAQLLVRCCCWRVEGFAAPTPAPCCRVPALSCCALLRVCDA
jgi:hypothetical protein